MKKITVFAFAFLMAVFTGCSSQKERIGLCFSGGGAKGAYEIGVWKALDELGLSKNVAAVSGTSVGALNAALFVNVNQKQASDLWQNEIGYFEVLTPDISKLEFSVKGLNEFRKSIVEIYENNKSLVGNGSVKHPVLRTAGSSVLSILKSAGGYAFDMFVGGGETKGLFSRDDLRTIILDNTSLEKFKSSKVKAYAATLKKDGLFGKTDGVDKTSYFLLNEQNNMQDISDILLASSAIPVAFDSQPISAGAIENGNPVGKTYQYVDGGFELCGGRNVPVKPLLDDETLDTIIIVYLKSADELDGKYVTAYGAYKDGYAEKLSTRNVIEIVPSQPLGNLLNGTMNFSSNQINDLISLGYADAVKSLSNRQKK